ncbi:MAG: cytochrome b [Thermoleophilia bacterium]
MTRAARSGTTRLLHWVTLLALIAQFTVGYLLEDDSGQGRGRGRGRGEESGQGRGRGRGGEDDDEALLTVHVALGLTILALAVIRVLWRRRTGLPPWAPTLRPAERTLAHWTERTMLLLLFAIPLTGLWLVLVNDDALALNIATHIAFFLALTAHVGLVLKHQLIDRDHLLRRML